jgi:hypothetical protein
LCGRIPVCTPDVILLTAVLQEHSLAIRVHHAASGQNPAPNVGSQLDVGLQVFQHLSHLLFSGAGTNDVDHGQACLW